MALGSAAASNTGRRFGRGLGGGLPGRRLDRRRSARGLGRLLRGRLRAGAAADLGRGLGPVASGRPTSLRSAAFVGSALGGRVAFAAAPRRPSRAPPWRSGAALAVRPWWPSPVRSWPPRPRAAVALRGRGLRGVALRRRSLRRWPFARAGRRARTAGSSCARPGGRLRGRPGRCPGRAGVAGDLGRAVARPPVAVPRDADRGVGAFGGRPCGAGGASGLGFAPPTACGGLRRCSSRPGAMAFFEAFRTAPARSAMANPHIQNGRTAGRRALRRLARIRNLWSRDKHATPVRLWICPEATRVETDRAAPCCASRAFIHDRARPVSAAVSPSQRASRPRRLTARSRRSAASRAAAVATISRLSPVRSRVRGCGHEAGAVAQHQGDHRARGAAAARRRRRRPGCEPAGISSCSRSARIRSRGAVSTRSSVASAGAVTRSHRAAGGDRAGLQHVKITTSTKTTSNRRSRPGDAQRERDRGQHDRHRAAQAGPGQEGLLAPAEPGTRSALSSDRHRPGEQHQHRADHQRRAAPRRAAAAARRAARAGRTGRSGPARPARRRSRARTAGAGCWALPRITAAHVDGQEAATRARAPPAAYASTVEADGGERVEAGRRQGDPAQPARPATPTAQRRSAAPATSSYTISRTCCHHGPSVSGAGRARTGDHEHDGRGVVDAGLGLEDRGQPGTEPQPPQGREDGGRVGGREHRAVEEGQLPGQPEQQVHHDRRRRRR